jgi:hypothetical protein
MQRDGRSWFSIVNVHVRKNSSIGAPASMCTVLVDRFSVTCVSNCLCLVYAFSSGACAAS